MPEKSENNQVDSGSAANAPDANSEPVKTLSKSAAETDLVSIDAPIAANTTTTEQPTEFGGQKGLEPTRYGDWEKNGRCTDF